MRLGVTLGVVRSAGLDKRAVTCAYLHSIARSSVKAPSPPELRVFISPLPSPPPPATPTATDPLRVPGCAFPGSRVAGLTCGGSSDRPPASVMSVGASSLRFRDRELVSREHRVMVHVVDLPQFIRHLLKDAVVASKFWQSRAQPLYKSVGRFLCGHEFSTRGDKSQGTRWPARPVRV